MDLSIKAEDVNNLIGAENENSADENLADENSEVDSEEENFNENEEGSLNDFD